MKPTKPAPSRTEFELLTVEREELQEEKQAVLEALREVEGALRDNSFAIMEATR